MTRIKVNFKMIIIEAKSAEHQNYQFYYLLLFRIVVIVIIDKICKLISANYIIGLS